MAVSWKVKPCGCVRARLERAGKVSIRCERHRGKACKRLLCHFADGMVRRG